MVLHIIRKKIVLAALLLVALLSSACDDDAIDLFTDLLEDCPDSWVREVEKLSDEAQKMCIKYIIEEDKLGILWDVEMYQSPNSERLTVSPDQLREAIEELIRRTNVLDEARELACGPTTVAGNENQKSLEDKEEYPQQVYNLLRTVEDLNGIAQKIDQLLPKDFTFVSKNKSPVERIFINFASREKHRYEEGDEEVSLETVIITKLLEEEVESFCSTMVGQRFCNA